MAGRAPAGHGGVVFSHVPKEERATLGVKLALLIWVLMLFDPHWLVARNGGPSVVLKLPVMVYLGLIGLLLFEIPGRPVLRQRWHWFAPILLYVLVGVVTTPFAVNNGFAREVLQEMLLVWVMMTTTVALVNGARRTEQLFLMYGLAFLWFGLWGARTGFIRWHHVLSNQDGFGAFMVLGLGFCSFMAMAAEKGRFRHLMRLAAAVAIVGVVASFARGAFLAAIAVFGVVFLRSNRKGMTLLAGLAAVVLIIAAAEIIHPGMFWLEMQSAFSEGTEEGTGEDRWELWMAAVEVFWQRPIFGVGFSNFGPFAASYFAEGDVGGRYSLNVGGLYNRSLHSLYFQTLSETGIVGSGAFIWILVDFWRRNKVLRTAAAQEYWRRLGARSGCVRPPSDSRWRWSASSPSPRSTRPPASTGSGLC